VSPRLRGARPGLGRPLAAATLAALAMGAAACGQAGDRQQVGTVTTGFLAARAHDDGAAACRLLSRDTRSELESEEHTSCRRAVGELDLDGGRVASAQVFLTGARVQLTSGESVFLSEQSGGWRLSALGCRPAGPPTSEPFDCELEA
jgi:hypothetical protein